MSLAWRLAGLFHPDWALRLGAAGTAARREEGPGGLELEGQVLARLGPFQGEEERVDQLLRSSLDKGQVEAVRLRLFEGCTARGSIWSQVVLQRAVLCALEDAQLRSLEVQEMAACSLRGARLEDCSIGELLMCDLSDARLLRVTLGNATTADFSGATFQDCDLKGADLRGAVLRGARFVGSDPSQARVGGADFAGARGLDRATRRRMLESGARFRSAAWYRLLRLLRPGADALLVERLALAAWIGSGILGLAISLAALWAVLRPPPSPPVPEVPAPLVRDATEWEIRKTRENLALLRTTLQQASQTMVAKGAASQTWPSMNDFQQNRYDEDGDGSSEVRVELVPGGLPDNLLTDARGGVLPYCNDEPTQETISGNDTDWHYCDRTGRIFASAGYTGLATLEW